MPIKCYNGEDLNNNNKIIIKIIIIFDLMMTLDEKLRYHQSYYNTSERNINGK